MDNIRLSSIPTLNLAFVGDAVFDLLVREYLVSNHRYKVGDMNKKKVELVNCKSQSGFAATLMDALSEEELAVFKRGRNSKPSSVSKHGTAAEYHSATGLEALFGYLYLSGEKNRIKELFSLIISGSND